MEHLQWRAKGSLFSCYVEVENRRMTSESNTKSSSFFSSLDDPTSSGKEESNSENLELGRPSFTRAEGTKSTTATAAAAATANTTSSMSKEIETGTADVDSSHRSSYDVLIGAHQNVIGAIISDVHKILHDVFFKGSIPVDTLGIKQIDYDIYDPPTVTFNQRHRRQPQQPQKQQQPLHQVQTGTVTMDIVIPIQTTAVSSVSTKLNATMKGTILATVEESISQDGSNKILVKILDSKVSIASSAVGGRIQEHLINLLSKPIKPKIHKLAEAIFSAISIPDISSLTKVPFNPLEVAEVNNFLIAFTTMASKSTPSSTTSPNYSSIVPSSASVVEQLLLSAANNFLADKLFIVLHRDVINAVANAHFKDNPAVHSGRESVNLLMGSLSVNYTLYLKDIDFEPILASQQDRNNKFSVSGNSTLEGVIEGGAGFIRAPYSATADIGFDAQLSLDPSSGNLRIHLIVTKLTNIHTQLSGVPNVVYDALSNLLSHDIVSALPQIDIEVLAAPTKISIGDGNPVTLKLTDIKYHNFDESSKKGGYVIVSGKVSLEK